MSRENTGYIRVRGPLQFRAGITLGGKEHSKTCSTQQEAEQWLSSLRRAHIGGYATDWLRDRKVTLAEALERYQAEVTPGKKSAETERRRIRRLLATEGSLCAMALHEIRTSDLKAFVKRRTQPSNQGKKGISGSAVNRELAVFGHLYVVARVEWGMDDLVNPLTKGLRRKENRARSRRLNDGEEDQLLVAARAYERECAPEIPITAVIRFALATAMRQGEIGRLRWENVNLQQATVLLEDTKNSEPRTVPLYPSTVRMLSSLERRDDGLVFGPTASLRQMWNRVLKHTPIKGLRFHDLRHEAISRFFEETDLSDMEIAMVSGHKTLIMLKRYAHLRANKLARKLARLEGGEVLTLVSNRSPATVIDEVPDCVLKRKQWKAISGSAVVLAALVRSKPVSRLASEFGVSDVAIHKACARLGVEKPPQGYWLRADVA